MNLNTHRARRLILKLLKKMKKEIEKEIPLQLEEIKGRITTIEKYQQKVLEAIESKSSEAESRIENKQVAFEKKYEHILDYHKVTIALAESREKFENLIEELYQKREGLKNLPQPWWRHGGWVLGFLLLVFAFILFLVK